MNKAYRKTLGRLESLDRRPRVVIREKGFQFDPSVVRARGDVYLVGYWRSPSTSRTRSGSSGPTLRWHRMMSVQTRVWCRPLARAAQ